MKNNIWMSHKFSFSYNLYPNPAVLIKEKSQKEHERSTFNVLLIYMKKNEFNFYNKLTSFILNCKQVLF